MRKNIPNEIVTIEPRVVATIILAANFALLPMASAITKLAIAVGAANRMKRMPNSSPLIPACQQTNVKVAGNIRSLITPANEIKAIEFLRL